VKFLRLFLALLLLPTGAASGFDLFAKKKRSDSDHLATDNGRPTRARELQQGMMDFSDRYTMRIWQALDTYIRSEKDPLKRSAAEHLKVLYSSASMEIAAGRNPSGNLLDMAVFTALAQRSVRDYWVPEVFGAGGESLVKAHRDLRADLDVVLSKTLTQEQRKELDRLIADYSRTNPGNVYVADVRLRDLVGARTAAGQQSGGIPLLADVSRAVGELDAAVEYGERLMFYVERLPRLTTMQTALALAQTGASPTVLSLTESARQTSQAIEQMPDKITLALSENSEALGALLPGIQSSIADSRAIMEITERIMQPVEGQSTDSTWTPEATAATLREARATAGEMRATLELLEKSLTNSSSLPLESLLKTTSEEARLTVDYAWNRLLLAIGLLLAGLLVLLFVAARLFRSDRQAKP
jgi:hypothetical protein